MSRYHEAAQDVGGAAGQEPAGGGCHAYGCPLPGAISESTKGGGPWFCRHHFGAGAALWPDITTRLRREQSELIDPTPAVPAAVQRIRAEVAEARARRTLAAPSREPGEDDDIDDRARARFAEPA